MSNYRISAALHADIGFRRENNEDNFYFNGKYLDDMQRKMVLAENSIDELNIYAVYDGMGGEAYGEVASLIAAKSLKKYHNILSKANRQSIDRYLNVYILEANNQICAESEKNGGIRMGTTLVLLYIKDNKVITYNIGDSRAYLFRNNELTQLSEDHTQSQYLVKMGLLNKDEAEKHKGKHKLTQHLGIHPDDMVIQAFMPEDIEINKNDIYLLCSDGLTDMLSDEDIAKILSMKMLSAKDLTDKLVETALENGGRDNVTVVIIKIEDK